MPLHIRVASEADLPEILAIYNHAVLHSTATADYEPATLEQRRVWLTSRQKLGLPVFVAERSGQTVGWSSLSPYKDRIGYRFTAETSVYVAADARGQGVGKALLAPLLDAGRAAGLHSLVASIDSENDASIALHAAFGFAVVGRMQATVYKFDRWLDVVYMQLLL